MPRLTIFPWRLAAAFALALPAVSARELLLNQLPLLFVDDSGVAAREGLVRTFHPAVTDAAPSIVADQPWEGVRVYIFGSAIRAPDGPGYRMWYSGRPQLEGTGPKLGYTPAVTLFATSADGRHWTKPALHLFPVGRPSANNIVFDFDSPSVLFDPADPDPARRYKMLGAHHGAYASAVSADGLHWRMDPAEPVLEHSDTITLSHDPFTREYLAYHKRPATVRGFPRRVVWLSRSHDFRHWTEPVLVFVPDAEDDRWTTRPQERTEVYNMSVFAHAGGFVGLPAILRVMKALPRSQVHPGQSPLDGPLDIQIAASRDGTHWTRSWPRLSIIPRGQPGTFDGGALLGVASQPVDTGDETWVYYTAINTGHGGTMPPKRTTIGRAVWRRHGFASLDAGPMGGSLDTDSFRLAGDRLWVNADAHRGKLRAALLGDDGQPVPGCTLEACDEITSDGTGLELRWRKVDQLPQGVPLHLHVAMTDTALYSISAGPNAR